MTPTEKEHYTKRLHGYTLADWQPLFNFIPQMESPEPPTGKDLENLVWGFAGSISHAPDIMIVFDWGRWDEGRAVVMQTKPMFDHYDLLTLCMFVTAIVRADRFSEGFLMQCYERGVIVSILKAIEARVEEQPH